MIRGRPSKYFWGKHIWNKFVIVVYVGDQIINQLWLTSEKGDYWSEAHNYKLKAYFTMALSSKWMRFENVGNLMKSRRLAQNIAPFSLTFRSIFAYFVYFYKHKNMTRIKTNHSHILNAFTRGHCSRVREFYISSVETFCFFRNKWFKPFRPLLIWIFHLNVDRAKKIPFFWLSDSKTVNIYELLLRKLLF